MASHFICSKAASIPFDIKKSPESNDINTNQFVSALEDNCLKLNFYTEICGTDFCCIGTGKNIFLIKRIIKAILKYNIIGFYIHFIVEIILNIFPQFCFLSVTQTLTHKPTYTWVHTDISNFLSRN